MTQAVGWRASLLWAATRDAPYDVGQPGSTARRRRLHELARGFETACSSNTATTLAPPPFDAIASVPRGNGGGGRAGADVAKFGVAEVTRWLCQTYSMPHRGRVAARVDRAAAALLAADPALGGISLQRDVLPKVEVLEALSPGLAWKVFYRYPEEFIHPHATDYWRIMAAVLYTQGLDPDSISALFRRHACLFARAVQAPGNVAALFDWLRGLGLDQPAQARVIDKNPLVLQADVERTLKPRLAYMQTGLGVSRQAAVKAVRRHPELLSVDSAALQQRADFLAGLGLDGGDIARLFASQPLVFACSVDDKLRPLVRLLREELGCDGELLQKMLAQSGLLARAPATIRARVAEWRRMGLGADALLGALRRFPRLLLYPVDAPKYQRKVQYLEEELGLAPGAALEAFPQYMSYSLARRTAPRVAAARRFAGMTPQLGMLALTDEAFCARLGIDAGEYAAFLGSWPATEECQRWAEA